MDKNLKNILSADIEKINNSRYRVGQFFIEPYGNEQIKLLKSINSFQNKTPDDLEAKLEQASEVLGVSKDAKPEDILGALVKKGKGYRDEYKHYKAALTLLGIFDRR